jgi:hypothetical protein
VRTRGSELLNKSFLEGPSRGDLLASVATWWRSLKKAECPEYEADEIELDQIWGIHISVLITRSVGQAV